MYNFIYVPFDFKKNIVFRYGFVNFEQHEHAMMAVRMLNGWAADSETGCEVEWSGQQSLHSIIQRYRNSPVMHCSVPDAYKPLLFQRGVRIPFPAPTQAVKAPKHVNIPAAQTPEVRNDSLQANAEVTHARDSRTTLIVKNLPTGCTHEELCRMLNEVGLGGMYNFIYVPCDFKKSVVLRYGFVNFEQHEQAVKAMALLDGFSGWVVDSEKNCEVEWGGAQQSLHANIERYRNSSLMHSSVPDSYKPVLFERGQRIAFPAPTKAVKPLKLRRTQQA
jgi:RNA recognition motif-containing protein